MDKKKKVHLTEEKRIALIEAMRTGIPLGKSQASIARQQGVEQSKASRIYNNWLISGSVKRKKPDDPRSDKGGYNYRICHSGEFFC